MSHESLIRTGRCPHCKDPIRIFYESAQEMYLPKQFDCACGNSTTFSGKARPSPVAANRESTTSGPGREAAAEAPSRVEKSAESTILRKVRDSISELYVMAGDYSASDLADNLTSILQQLAPILDPPARPIANAEVRRLMVKLSADASGLKNQFSKAIADAATDIREANTQARANLAAGLAEIVRLQTSQAQEVALAARDSISSAAEAVVGDGPMSRLETHLGKALKDAVEREFGEGRELRIDDVLEIFDIFDGFRQFWDHDDELTKEEASARPQVVATLGEFRERMLRWAARHRLSTFPDEDSGPVAFDVAWHRRVDTEKTDDVARDGTIAQVALAGYSWKGQRLRKADVIVYKYAPITTPGETAVDE